MSMIVITRKSLVDTARDLPINDIDIGDCSDNILQKIKPDTTVVIILDDAKEMNNKICSKVLRTPDFTSPNVVMTQEQYDNLDKRCRVYKRQQAIRFLKMNRIPTNVANQYMDAVEKCDNWKPKI